MRLHGKVDVREGETFNHEDIGIVIETHEPTINFAEGVAVVQYDQGTLRCFWRELMILREDQTQSSAKLKEKK